MKIIFISVLNWGKHLTLATFRNNYRSNITCLQKYLLGRLGLSPHVFKKIGIKQRIPFLAVSATHTATYERCRRVKYRLSCQRSTPMHVSPKGGANEFEGGRRGSMHWRWGGQYSKKMGGAWSPPQLQWWHRPCMWPTVSHGKIAPQKSPGGDFLTDGDRETFARFIHDHRLWENRPSAIYSRSPHDADFFNGGNFFTWWLNRFAREKLAPLWSRLAFIAYILYSFIKWRRQTALYYYSVCRRQSLYYDDHSTMNDKYERLNK